MSQTTTITPTVTGTAVTSASAVQICPYNGSRGALLIHNPNATGILWIAPIGLTPVPNGAGSFAINPLDTAVFNDGTRATCGWLAILSGATNGNVTVQEFAA